MPYVCVFKTYGFTTAPQAILIRDGETKAHLPCCLQSNGGGGRQRQRWDESSGRKLLRSISSAPECVVVLRSAGPQPINQTALCPLWFWSTRKINFWSYPHPFLQRRMKSLRCNGWSLRTHVVRPCHGVATQIYSTALMKMKLLAYTFMSIHDWKCWVELFFLLNTGPTFSHWMYVTTYEPGPTEKPTFGDQPASWGSLKKRNDS